MNSVFNFHRNVLLYTSRFRSCQSLLRLLSVGSVRPPFRGLNNVATKRATDGARRRKFSTTLKVTARPAPAIVVRRNPSISAAASKIEAVEVETAKPAEPVNNALKRYLRKRVSIRKGQRRAEEKEKLAETEKMKKEISLNRSLISFLEVHVFCGNYVKAHKALLHYRSKGATPLIHVAAYNVVIQGYASQGDYQKTKELFQLIIQDGLKPDVQSYAGVLECLGRFDGSTRVKSAIRKTISAMTHDNISLDDLFNECIFQRDQREVILKAIRAVREKYVPKLVHPPKGYDCSLLVHLNNETSRFKSPSEGLITVEELKEQTKKQLEKELHGSITIKSIEKKEDEGNISEYRSILERLEKSWYTTVKESIERSITSLENQSKRSKNPWGVSLHPFLACLSPDEYSRIIVLEVRKLAEGSETFSPGVTQLHREIGQHVLSRFQVIQKKETGVLDKIDSMYQDYLQWYIHPDDGRSKANNVREKWQEMLHSDFSSGPTADAPQKGWSPNVVVNIGRFLYRILMRDVKIDANVMRQGSKTEQIVPAFYSIFRMQGAHLKEEIKPHPVLVKLFQAASRDELTFATSLVPMRCPPLPWASVRTGGYLLSDAKIVRLPAQCQTQLIRMEEAKVSSLYPALDSLNQLGSIPWKINDDVLDIVIEVFNSKGNDSIGIPPPPSECPPPPSIEPGMSKEETMAIHKQRLALKRRKAEMFSLWCDALYRFSLANHFRNSIFWLPHNMDFRGRVYPCPPHLSHLGADPARAILVFAQGQPLGPEGLDWLKIHLINLTGLKKRESVQARLTYADSIMDDILDSAANPLTGKKWWMESDEPWQTLACCIEIKKAKDSGDPTTFVSHFPIHQDGSCNGLQHYAALGRDEAGAESVNLCPNPIPGDVYMAVATLVEKQRAKDASEGHTIAQNLEGFIGRKVIKQTVMTTVYGVTRYGARLQIAKQLKDLDNFPQAYVWAASLYLTTKTFDSLQEMFTSTKKIQDWFTECARLISQYRGEPVEWVTPIGLPVIQPYFKAIKSFPGYNPNRLAESTYSTTSEKPNVMKQKNAFPPNYIHSLDSTHMMLTSLNCERTGITFVSVHDCYWTHAITVGVMNKICREQFVALHSQPILENLSQSMLQKYGYEVTLGTSNFDLMSARFNQLLKDVPPQGSFDLRKVLESIYFFS